MELIIFDARFSSVTGRSNHEKKTKHFPITKNQTLVASNGFFSEEKNRTAIFVEWPLSVRRVHNCEHIAMVSGFARSASERKWKRGAMVRDRTRKRERERERRVKREKRKAVAPQRATREHENFKRKFANEGDSTNGYRRTW